MKGINFANIGLGMELSPSFSQQHQEGLLERLQAMLAGLTNNATGVVVLSGCVMSVVSNQYNQTAGVVYYQGEIYTVDAFAGNSATLIPVYQAATTIYTGQAWYGDGAKRDTFYVKKLPMAMGASGSGISNYNAVVRIENIVNPGVQNALNNKANSAQGSWANIAPTAPWQAQNYQPRYIKDQFEKVQLGGELWTVGTNLAAGTLTIFQLPSGFRPTQVAQFPIQYTNAGGLTVGRITIDANGVMALTAYSGVVGTAPSSVPLDSISFFTF